MSQTQGGPDKPPVVRADELLDNLGRRIGLFAGLAGQRVQSAAVNVRDQTRRMSQPATVAEEQASQPAGAEEAAQPETEKATAKAEELVEGMTQRLSLYAARAGLQIQKTAARAREAAEDIWAEAQSIRKNGGHS